MSWADDYYERTDRWPNAESGTIVGADGLTWCAVDNALRSGLRQMPGGSSLAKLLAAERGTRNRGSLPRLSRKTILAWADAHYRRTGTWPISKLGTIPEAPHETWQSVDSALRKGYRGLRSRSSLARLLTRYRGKTNHLNQPGLSEETILAWVDAHLRRTGKWPHANSGPVIDAPGETWRMIDNALRRKGYRQLEGGSSLFRLLVKRRGVRNPRRPPHLSEEIILYWAELDYQRTGAWPQHDSGPIWRSDGETWAQVDSAFRSGKRKLPGGSSLAKFLASRGIFADGSYA